MAMAGGIVRMATTCAVRRPRSDLVVEAEEADRESQHAVQQHVAKNVTPARGIRK